MILQNISPKYCTLINAVKYKNVFKLILRKKEHLTMAWPRMCSESQSTDTFVTAANSVNQTWTIVIRCTSASKNSWNEMIGDLYSTYRIPRRKCSNYDLLISYIDFVHLSLERGICTGYHPSFYATFYHPLSTSLNPVLYSSFFTMEATI